MSYVYDNFSTLISVCIIYHTTFYSEMLRHTLDTNEIIKQIEESKADIIISFPHMLHKLVQAGLNTDALKWFHSCSAGKTDERVAWCLKSHSTYFIHMKTSHFPAPALEK